MNYVCSYRQKYNCNNDTHEFFKWKDRLFEQNGEWYIGTVMLSLHKIFLKNTLLLSLLLRTQLHTYGTVVT